MKKTLSMLLLLSIIFTFSACSKENKQPNVNDIMSTIRNEIEFPEMADIEKNNIDIYYEIDHSIIDQLAYIIAGSGITADEVLILKVTDNEQLDNIRTLIEAKRATQKDIFADYAPNEVSKIDKSVLEIKDNYLFYAVTNDNSKAKKLFNDAF